MQSSKRFIFKLVFITFLLSGCGFKVASTGDHDSFIISGLIPSLLGSSSLNSVSSKVNASSCTNTARLYKIESDGSINESSALATNEVVSGRYSFDVKSLGLTNDSTTINYLVKVETCSGGTLKRPVTNFDTKQDIDAKSTVIAEVINANSLTPKKLNESNKAEVESLMKSLTGETTSTALDSLTSNPTLSNQFQQIFGASSTILREAKPEVTLTTPFNLNESATSAYTISAFHIDPNYSFSYKWKLDGVVKSSAATWNYIPSPNDSGNHQIDVYIGMDNGSGGIDLSKPYYAKTITVIVNNNVLPVAPDIQINSGTPSPRNTNSIQVDLSTGVALANCSTFSHLAITDTNTIPGIMQFNIDCTSSGTQTENITFTNTDGAKTLYLWAIDNAGQISNAKSVNFVLDTTVPTAILSFAETNIKGGSSYTINLSGSDVGVGLDHLKLYFANDATTYSLVATVSNSATSYSWAAPTIDTIHGKLKFIATDLLGFTTTVYSNEFAIDSTAPSALSLARSTSSISNSTIVGIDVTGCSGDALKMLFSESSTVPAVNAAGWENCAGAKNFTVTGSDGLKTVYGFAKDAVGNISAVSTVAMTFDTTNPVISAGPVIASSMAGGSLQNITWTATDSSTVTINLEYYDGSGWNSIVTGNSNSGTYSWSVPSLNTNTAKIRLTALDAAGNSVSVTGSDFTIDSTAPVVSSVLINDGATYAGTSLVNVKANLVDNFDSSGLYIRLAAANSGNSDCQSEYVNNNWVSYISATTNISFPISPVDGVKKVCVWSKDSNENISVMSPTAGTLNVNTAQIIFQTGNLPQVQSLSIVNTSNGSFLYTIGAGTTISWSLSDTEGLDNNPIAIAYSTDGANWKDIVTQQNFSISSNLTWIGGLSGNPTTATGSYTLFTAPSSSFFILKAIVKDSAGNIGIPAQSQPQNVNGWSVYAGSTDRGDGGSGVSAAIYSDTAGMGQIFAIDPKTNNIYAMDAGVGIRKLDIQSGKVSTYILSGTLNLSTIGTIDSALSRVSVTGKLRMVITASGIMYLGVTTGAGQNIYKIDLSTNQYSLYAGGGTLNTTAATQSSIFINSGAFDVDAANNLYFFTDCDPAAASRLTPKILFKLSQNPDGSAGGFTHLAGNCTNGAITYGQSAVTQPITVNATSNYVELATIAAVDSNLIYYSQYSENPIKISNGNIYSASIGANSVAGIVTYNRLQNRIYRSVAGGSVSYFTPVAGLNGGEVLTSVVASNGAGSCMVDGIDAGSACVNVDSGFSFDSNGNYYFADGIQTTSPNGYRIRYVDSTNKVRTILGSLPFYGEGLDAGMIRGKIAGIYYKKSTESNLTAFPLGLYLISPHMVFGHIDSVTNKFQTLFGSQQSKSYWAPTGTTISSNVIMGLPYGGGNGYSLTFDSDGLPWMRTNYGLVSIDANRQVVNRTGVGLTTFWDQIADGASPLSGSLHVYGGINNLATKGNNGIFISNGYSTIGLDPIPQIRFFDYSNLTSNKIIGGGYLKSLSTPMTVDVSTPGSVKNAPFAYNCTNGSACMMQYVASQDRLYFSNSVDTKLRFITNPSDTAASTLTTMPTQFLFSPINFIFKEDMTQLFYISNTGLYCMDISSGKAWCNNSTNLYPYSATMGIFSYGPNQMTWKDSTTLLISTYNGKILQYLLPP